MGVRKLFSVFIALSLILVTIPMGYAPADEWIISEVDEDCFWGPYKFDDVDMVYSVGDDIQITGWYFFEGPDVLQWGRHVDEAILSFYFMGSPTTDTGSSFTLYGQPARKGGALSIYDDPDAMNGPFTTNSVTVDMSNVSIGWFNVSITMIIREINQGYYFWNGHSVAFTTLSSDDHEADRFFSSEENGKGAKLYIHYKPPESGDPDYPDDPPVEDPEYVDTYRNYTIWIINSSLPLDGWIYRQAKEINQLDEAGENYQVKIKVYYDEAPGLFDTMQKDNAHNPLTIPYQGANGALHPDVLYFPERYANYSYWMVYTPYPPGALEEPCILKSNDGVTWTEDGITNPVITKGAFDEVPDPAFVYVAKYSTWFMAYGQTSIGVSTKLYLATSGNGTTYVEYGILIDGSEAYEKDDGAKPWVKEPTIIFEDDWFYIWYDVLNTEADVNNKRWACLARFQWDNDTKQVINFERDATNPILHEAAGGGYDIGQGHIDVSSYDDVYHMYALRWITASGGRYDLCYWNSTDKINWVYQGVVIAHGGAGEWDEQYAYRGGPVTNGVGEVVLISDRLIFYYSGAPPPGTLPDIGIAYSYEGGIDFGGWSQADFDDVRFTESDGVTFLDYWMQEKVDSDYAVFWVEVSHNLTASGTTIYIYYGNATVTTTSNGWDTFPLFDDFDDTSLNVTTWTAHKSGSVNAIVDELASGQLQLAGEAGVSSNGAVRSNLNFTNNFELRYVHEIDEEHYSTASIGNASLQDETGGAANWWQTVIGNGYSYFWQSPVSGETVADPHDVAICESADGGAIASLATLDSGGLTTLNANHTLAMQYLSDGSLIWYHDDDFWLSASDTTYVDYEKGVLIGQGEHGPSGNGGNKLVDWAFVRKCVGGDGPYTQSGAWEGEETEKDDIYLVVDGNGTIVWEGTLNGDDIEDIIDEEVIGYPDPEDPNPPGWDEESWLTASRFKFILFIIGMVLMLGSPVYGFAERPEAATWIILFMNMIVGVALLWSLQTM